MRTQSVRTQVTTLALAICALVVLWTGRPAPRVLAFQDSEDKPSPIGIAFGQTLYLNVANTGATEAIPVVMRILDDDGNPLKVERQLVLPGKTKSISLNRDDLPERAGFRLLTRAEVSSLGGPDTRNLVVSQEIVNNETQRTMVLHPGISKGFNPQPDPPGDVR